MCHYMCYLSHICRQLQRKHMLLDIHMCDIRCWYDTFLYVIFLIHLIHCVCVITLHMSFIAYVLFIASHMCRSLQRKPMLLAVGICDRTDSYDKFIYVDRYWHDTCSTWRIYITQLYKLIGIYVCDMTYSYDTFVRVMRYPFVRHEVFVWHIHICR